MFHMETFPMGIINLDDELHDQLRRASSVACRSINAQAAFWIKVGMLCELEPTLSYNDIVTRELQEAGVKYPVAGGAK